MRNKGYYMTATTLGGDQKMNLIMCYTPANSPNKIYTVSEVGELKTCNG